jgi:biopolymer transport protein ExbB/TolQ
VQHDLSLSKALFWQAPDWQQGLQVLKDTEKEGWLSRLAQAAQAPTAGTLAASAPVPAQTERALRDALHQACARLHHGHTFLASVAACAPFVGLLGTVWGIRRAMLGMDASTLVGLDRLAAPVGEALLMTALGLGVPKILRNRAASVGVRGPRATPLLERTLRTAGALALAIAFGTAVLRLSTTMLPFAFFL